MRFLLSARWLLLAMVLLLVSASSHAGILISVGFAPPALPVYEQPDGLQPGMMWTPGYWAFGAAGYYWIPGAWVPAPYNGALWTPGYWGWERGRYFFHEGYWGRHVGYYGGVNYGFGYGGVGFAGGEWRGHDFHYNTAIMHVDGRYIHKTFEDRERVDRGFVARDSHVAFSGGPGGIRHEPGAEERLAEHDEHQGRTSFQEHHENFARNDKSSYASNNGGHPAHGSLGAPSGGTGSGSGNAGDGGSHSGGANAHAISIDNNQGNGSNHAGGSSKTPTPIDGNYNGNGSSHNTTGTGGLHSSQGSGSGAPTGSTTGSSMSTGSLPGNKYPMKPPQGSTGGSTGTGTGTATNGGGGSTTHTQTNMSVTLHTGSSSSGSTLSTHSMTSSGGGAPTRPVPCMTGYVNGVCGSGSTPHGSGSAPTTPGGSCPAGMARGAGGNCMPAKSGNGSSSGSGSSNHSPGQGGGQTTLPVPGHGGAQPMISHASGGSQGTHSNPPPSRRRSTK